MRPGLIGQVRRRWAPRGVKIRQLVEFTYEWACRLPRRKLSRRRGHLARLDCDVSNRLGGVAPQGLLLHANLKPLARYVFDPGHHRIASIDRITSIVGLDRRQNDRR